MVALRHHVARLRQQHHHLLQILKILARLLPQDLLQVFHRDGVEVARHQVLLELAHPLHLAHQLERVLVAEALGTVEHVLIAIAKILEVANIFVFLEQLVEVFLRLRVLELVTLELAHRLRQPPRHPRQLALLFLDARLLSLERFQRRALAIQDILELLLHLRQRVLQIEVAIALAHLLAQLLDELLEPHHLDAVEVHPLPHHPVHRLAHVVGVRQVLGQLLEHLVGVELEPLGAVPLRVAGDYCGHFPASHA